MTTSRATGYVFKLLGHAAGSAIYYQYLVKTGPLFG